MTEAEFLRAVVELAMWNKWATFHQLPAMTRRGMRSTVMGHIGFVDLVLARRGVVLFRELKSEKGQLTPEQRDWGKQLGDAWAVWRPSMMPEIIATLTVKPAGLAVRRSIRESQNAHQEEVGDTR